MSPLVAMNSKRMSNWVPGGKYEGDLTSISAVAVRRSGCSKST